MDGITVKALETLTPESISERKLIETLAETGGIFPTLDRSTVLNEVLPRLLRVQGRIPSFLTFFEDTIYLEACVNSLRLILPPKREISIRESLYHSFTETGLAPGIIKIQTRDNKFRFVHGGAEQRKKLGYLMLFLAAMRDFPILSQTAPHQSRGERKPLVEGSTEERLSYLALLAREFGFRTPQIETLANEDPSTAAARAFIRQLCPADQYEINTVRAEALALYMAEEIRAIATPRYLYGSPEFSGYREVPKRLRCGLPDNVSHKRDRNHLFLDTMYNHEVPQGYHLTSLAFQRDIFICFFGTDTIPEVVGGQSTESEIRNEGEGYLSPAHTRQELARYNEDHLILDHFASSPQASISSNYSTRSISEASTGPASGFSEYLASIQGAVWPHSQSPNNITATEDQPLAPGFERSIGRKMNMSHALEENIIPSEAVRQFIIAPTILIIYLWRERRYIKFWPSERWDFEETICSLADCGTSFAFFQGDEVTITGLAGLWAASQDCKLVFAGPKSTMTKAHDAARPVDSFLERIDRVGALRN